MRTTRRVTESTEGRNAERTIGLGSAEFLSILFSVPLWIVLLPATVFAQGYAPDIAASKMTVADGLKVELVVAEPLLRQPVAIDFDNRGRLWAIQYLQYPNPAGLRRVKVDRYSRTAYDRVPDPPPRGPRGADRLTIYEDSDGDGQIDRAKDFIAGLNLASGFAFGHGGVFVLQAPYLLFYPDRNGDDVPDGEPDVCLTGFGMEDAHSVANSLAFGPDGWLYGCQGSTVTANVRGIEFQQGVWRYHPITRRFELYCEGGGNSWGLDFDATGQLLYSTNVGGHVMLHGRQGAYYWKSFGKHGGLHNPFAYGYFDHVPHTDFRGGHVTVGGLVYQGMALPSTFRGKYVAADLLGHAIHWHHIEPNGSTFRSRHGETMLAANDTWFAPSDVVVGPDGAIYVADWHDRRMAHPDPDAEWDRRNGRVYRISATVAKQTVLPDFTRLASTELLRFLGDENDWLARRARQTLADRRDPEVIFPLRTIVLESTDAQLALKALWALYVSGGFSEPFAEAALSHRVAAIREWAVRLLGDDERVDPGIARRLAALASAERDLRVCAQLAATAKRLPADTALPIILALAGRDDFSDDPHLPNLMWWALERHSISAQRLVLDVLAVGIHAGPASMKRRLLERLMRRYATLGTPAGDSACVRLLANAETPEMLAALNQGWKDRSVALAITRDLREFLNPRLAQCTDAELATEMQLRLADPRADKVLRRSLGDPRSRGWALRLIGELGTSSHLPLILNHLDDIAAIRALRRFDDPAVAPALLEELPRLKSDARVTAFETLASRASWAKRLLAEVDAGRIGAKDIPLDVVRPLALLQDRQIDAVVRKHWGKLEAATPEERLAEVRRLNNDLRAGEGDSRRGREIFRKACATCHQLFGEGERTGPDLTAANRKDRDYLLVSIVDPSAIIRKEYLSYVMQTKDGRTIAGLIAEQSQAQITLLTAKNERIAMPRDRIESLEESPTSLMPDNLLKQLTPQELRDLFRYLQSDKPPP